MLVGMSGVARKRSKMVADEVPYLVEIRHVNVKVTTGKDVLVDEHHRFNIVTNIMYGLGWSSRWTVEATIGKKIVEAANSHRNPQGFNTRGRSTTMKQGARKMITTIHSNTTTRTIMIKPEQVVADKMDFIVGNLGVPPGF